LNIKKSRRAVFHGMEEKEFLSRDVGQGGPISIGRETNDSFGENNCIF